MSAVLARLRDHFLAPPVVRHEAPAVQVAQRAAPATLGVLCAPGAAPLAGNALGLAAARRAGAPCAVVCRWTGGEQSGAGGGGWASGGARRMASRLAARGLTVGTRGRLVLVALPGDGVAARAAAERAIAAAGDAPVVVVVAGARVPELDPLLAAQDRLIVVPAPDAPEGLEGLALSEAARLGRATGVLHVSPSTGGRLGAALGLGPAPALAAAARAALDGHA